MGMHGNRFIDKTVYCIIIIRIRLLGQAIAQQLYDNYLNKYTIIVKTWLKAHYFRQGDYQSYIYNRYRKVDRV